MARPTQRQVEELVKARAAVNANPKISGEALQSQVKSLARLDVGMRMTCRAQAAINKENLGNFEQDFSKIRSLVELFCAANPTSHFDFGVDAQGRYQRVFLSNPIVPLHETHGQKVLGVDGTFMKHGSYRETMLVLVGRNGNNNNVILAIGLCKSEDEKNCAWFLRNAREAGVTLENVPVFFDRGRGLCAALEKGGHGLFLRFCTRHIVGNIKTQFKENFPPDLTTIVYRIQAAQTEEEFQSLVFTLQLTHPAIAEYVANISPEKWTMYPAEIQGVKLYGWRTTNFVESENSKAVTPRHMFPLQLLMYYMDAFMKDAVENEKLGKKWAREGHIVTPYAHEKIESERSQVADYSVMWKNETVAFVRSVHVQYVQHRVDLDAKSCTCPHIRQYGLPCRHYLGALKDAKTPEKLYDVCDACYFVKNFREGYGCGDNGGVELVQPECISNDSTLPPEQDLSSGGRNKTKRIPSQGEESNSASKKGYQCGSCGQTGHNSRTCPRG